MSRSERYNGRHRAPGRHRMPGSGFTVPRRTGAAVLGVGVVAAAVSVPAMGLAGAGGTDSAEADGAAFAQLALTSVIPSAAAPGAGVAVSRSRTRESVVDLDDQVRPAVVATTPPAAAPVAIPTAAPIATPAPAAKSTFSTSAYEAAAARIGLRGYARVVYSAVRTTFGITNIGGYRPGDPRDHGTGHATDVMITSKAQGDAVAAFVMAHAAEFHVKYVIWRQRIWFPGGTWEAMADRGSITANHYDHVHVSVTS